MKKSSNFEHHARGNLWIYRIWYNCLYLRMNARWNALIEYRIGFINEFLEHKSHRHQWTQSKICQARDYRTCDVMTLLITHARALVTSLIPLLGSIFAHTRVFQWLFTPGSRGASPQERSKFTIMGIFFLKNYLNYSSSKRGKQLLLTTLDTAIFIDYHKPFPFGMSHPEGKHYNSPNLCMSPNKNSCLRFGGTRG